MNSRERMAAAMSGRAVDRTPLMCQLSLSHIYKNTEIPAFEYWFTHEGCAKGYIEMAEKYKFDGILVNKRKGIPPYLRENVLSLEKLSEGDMICFENGARYLCPPDDDPRLQNRPQVPTRSISEVEVDEVKVIASAYDVCPWYGNILDIVLAQKSDTLSIHGEIGTAFETFLLIFGSFEAGLFALMDDGEKSKEIINRINQNCIVYAREQCSKGIDALKLSSPMAGAGFISPDMYEEFVLPYEKAIIDMVHEEFAIPCYIHTCGAIGDRLDLMVKTGTDGLECLDPPPLGTVDLEEAVGLIGDKCFIKGNLDSVNELTKSPEEVYDIAMKRIAIGKRAKGYILSSACSVSSRVPPENIKILYDAVTAS